MIELHGKHAIAKVFTDIVDEESISQVINLANQEFVIGSTIRMMPDIHAGAGCTIGTTMTIKDKIVPNLVGVDIGCVDKDTEFLARDGWHKISDYNNEEIAIYDLNTDSTYFSLPNAYIKNPEKEFYHFKTKYGIDQMVSKEHRCLVRRGNQNRSVSRDLPYVLTAEEIYTKHNRIKIGFRDNFVCEIPNIINRGLSFSNEELRLIIMYSADGITSHTSNLLRCAFKKEHKIARCKELLTKANIQFSEKICDEVTTIFFRFDYDFKNLSSLYELTKEQLSIVCDEVMHWDGSLSSMQYTTTIKENADFIQYAFACNGYRTNIDIDTRDKYRNGACYRVSIADSRPRVQLAGTPKTPIEIVPSQDGYKYCFNTDTGFWIMRRNGCICVTGNCGMRAVKLADKHLDLPNLDKVIRENVPSGFNIRDKAHSLVNDVDLKGLRCFQNINLDRAEKSIGTLGGGNHFIEVDKDDEGTLYLIVHSGSRHLGVEIASYYQRLAYEQLNQCSKDDIQRLIANLKATGKQRQIESEIKKLKNTKRTSIPKDMAYLEGGAFDNYIHDMRIAQHFAMMNRKAITDIITQKMGLYVTDEFTTIHNYIDLDNMILRKGAVSAQAGERLLIPINMRDGSLLCIGKGNPDWNYSAPHGAGRLMSRAKAKEVFGVDEFQKEMDGIYTTSVCYGTLDECPMAYKPIDAILDNITDTVDVVKIIKPIYNFKATEAEIK